MYKQIAERCDQETTINIDYEIQEVHVYTNKATVMNRLVEKFPNNLSKEAILNGEVAGIKMTFPLSELKYIANASLFRAK